MIKIWTIFSLSVLIQRVLITKKVCILPHCCMLRFTEQFLFQRDINKFLGYLASRISHEDIWQNSIKIGCTVRKPKAKLYHVISLRSNKYSLLFSVKFTHSVYHTKKDTQNTDTQRQNTVYQRRTYTPSHIQRAHSQMHAHTHTQTNAHNAMIHWATENQR